MCLRFPAKPVRKINPDKVSLCIPLNRRDHGEPLEIDVPYYGGGMVNAPKPGAKAPIDYVENLRASVLAFFGGKDAFIPLSDVDKFRDALNKAGKQADVVLYPDADHGFMCEERPSFHPTHSKEAWAKTIAFFKQHLV